MKIAVTGHTRGFGKFIYDTLATEHVLHGFSKSTGCDIGNEKDTDTLISQIEDCDIFINNAQDRFYQTELLYKVFDRWDGQHKSIINIGSNSRDFTNKKEADKYSIEKNALNLASKQLGRIGKCKVSIIEYGFLIRDHGSSIGYAEAFNYLELAINAHNKDHRLLEVLVAHD